MANCAEVVKMGNEEAMTCIHVSHRVRNNLTRRLFFFEFKKSKFNEIMEAIGLELELLCEAQSW